MLLHVLGTLILRKNQLREYLVLNAHLLIQATNSNHSSKLHQWNLTQLSILLKET